MVRSEGVKIFGNCSVQVNKTTHSAVLDLSTGSNHASILYKSTAGRYRPVSYPDGPITARCRFIKNAYWELKWTCSNFRTSMVRSQGVLTYSGKTQYV